MVPGSYARGCAVVGVTLALLAGAVPAGATRSETALPGDARILVAVRDPSVLDELPDGVRTRAALPLAGTHVLEVVAHRRDAVLAELSAHPDVVYAEPDEARHVEAVTPDDPQWTYQWGARTTEVPTAWEATTGSATVTVAVLDSGVSPHEDLEGALLTGFNVLTGTTDVTDVHGHGTAVTGVAAARGNNGVGIAGICWACRVLPVKVLDDDGSGRDSDIAAGIVWATDEGADVVNLSLGGPVASLTLARAVTYAADRGVVLVAAAGNDKSTEARYPAAYPEVIGVASSTADDSRDVWSNHGSWVDVAAPGCAVTTVTGGGYEGSCGTSFAAPLVAGVAGLALSHAPAATPAQVREALMGTAVPRAYVAAGRVRAGETLRAVHTAAGGPDAPPRPDPNPAPAPDLEPEPGEDPPLDPGPGPAPEPPARETPGPVAACPAGGVPSAGFADVVGGTHARAIDCVVWLQLSQGLGDGRFGPSRGVRRDQMASFLARTLEAVGVTLPAPAGSPFRDTAGNPHERAITQLAQLGVVQGRARDRYDPAATVRRDQMAAFLARAYEQVRGSTPAAPATHFDDIAGNVHRQAIDVLAEAGVVNGQAPRTYAPARVVRRDQMASFLARLLDVLAEEGHPPARSVLAPLPLPLLLPVR